MSSRQFKWLVVLAAVLMAGCPKPAEREVSMPPAQMTMPAQVPPPQLSYRERKAQGLLTPEELQDERELQEIEKQIDEARRQEHEDVQRRQEVSAAPPTVEGSGKGSKFVGVKYPEAPEEYKRRTYVEAVRKEFSSEELQLGMNQDQVQIACGPPTGTQLFRSKGRAEVVWYYGRWQLTFENDCLTSINKW